MHCLAGNDRAGRRTYNLKYFITLANGQQIDLAEADLATAYQQIAAALRGKSFEFDSHQVPVNCDTPSRKFYVQRPQ